MLLLEFLKCARGSPPHDLPPTNDLPRQNSGLAAYDRAVFDVGVVTHPCLPADEHVFAQSAAAGNACLRSQDRMLANLNVVGDLDQIVDFSPLPICVASSEPRSTAAFEAISTSSPISTVPIWGNFQWPASPKT